MLAAIERGDGPSVERLLAEGVDPNVSISGMGLLTYASKCAEIVHILLRHGARFDPRRDDRFLSHAAYHGNHELLELACNQGLDIHKRPRGGLTPLEQAVAAWDLDTLEHLVALGATAGDLKWVRWFAVSGPVILRLVELGAHVPEDVLRSVHTGEWDRPRERQGLP